MQEKTINIENRISYLAEMFDVFNEDDLKEKLESYKELGFDDVIEIKNPNTDKLIAIVSFKERKKNSTKKLCKVSVELEVLSMMIAADPTINKIYLQWMLNVFTSLIKKLETQDAISFACEDLPKAKDYLILFDANKRKDKFERLCKNNFTLNKIVDYSNINQYETLSQLFDAVDPFIVRDSKGILSLMHRYVELNQAEIPFRDKIYTLYIPKTIDASVIFHDFTNWCTARIGNSNYKTYVNQKRPDGKKSKLFIIIPNDFFDGSGEELYQFHIESGQFMDRKDRTADIDSIFNRSEKLKHYFSEYFADMISFNRTNLKSCYVTWMFKLGMGYKLLEMMPENIGNIKFIDKNLDLIPDVSKFTNLSTLVLVNCRISKIHDTIGTLTKLTVLSLPENKLSDLPESIGNLRNLKMLVLTKNQIKNIPDNITYLDPKNGGSLQYLIISRNEISYALYEKLNKLLPSVSITDPHIKKDETL